MRVYHCFAGHYRSSADSFVNGFDFLHRTSDQRSASVSDSLAAFLAEYLIANVDSITIF